jgi:hypothetical protein
LHGQVLLDDDLPIQARVPREVGDSKAAAAQNTLDDKFLDASSWRERL